jgi:hypothetical protein
MNMLTTKVIFATIAGASLLGLGGAALAENGGSGGSDRPVYPVNERGQTYGSEYSAATPDEAPDLIDAIGKDGTPGYVLATDLEAPPARTPEERMAQDDQSVKVIPLYARDGVTVIGEFTLSPPTPEPVSGK